MKKLLLLACTVISLQSFAQIIYQSDLPFAGLGWTSGVDTTYNDPVPMGGAGQTWDFSGLQIDYIDTTGFMDAAGTPYASTFPDANLAAHKQGTDAWSYFTNESTGFYVNGYVTGGTEIVIDPRQMYVPVPFTYGNAKTDISRVEIDTTFLTYAAKIILNYQADFLGDGNGTLITPTGTYPGTLRVRETLLETDSLLVDYLGQGNYVTVGWEQKQRTFFRWFQTGGTANYLLGIDADSLGDFALRSDYLIQWAVLGTHDMSAVSPFLIYPNPSSGMLTISNTAGHFSNIEIMDCTGKRVKRFQPESPSSLSEMKLDLSSLPSGMYFYCLTSDNKVFRGKLNVVH